METLAGMPFAELAMDRDGQLERPDGALFPEGITDLIVLSHGWKNSREDALALYGGILAGARDASTGLMDAGRRFAAIGVFWPALRYQQDLSLVHDDVGVPAGGAAGGGASLASAGPGDQALRAAAADLARALGEDPATLADQAAAATGGGGAADGFLRRLRAALSAAQPDVVAEHRDLMRAPGDELVARLSLGADVATCEPADGDAGTAAGLGAPIVERGWRMLSGGKAAVATLLNQATYYEMKARAGIVGAALGAFLDAQVPANVKVHLVGHSFGARLVTSACTAMHTTRPGSLSLLQAAFSHNGFGTGIGARKIDGGFRRVVSEGMVSGPLLVTHTRRDTAVGFFYALASTASGEIAKAAGRQRPLIGGPDDLHGGLGANGARSMREGEAIDHVAAVGAAPNLVDGRVNNVKADAIVSSHNDVANAEVGRLVWRAMR